MEVWDKLWKREKGRRKHVICKNLKQTPRECSVALRGV